MGSDCLATGRLSPEISRLFVHVQCPALTSKERLIALQVGDLAVDNTAIGRDDITVRKKDDIAWYDVFYGNNLCNGIAFTVGMADNRCLRRADGFERGDSLNDQRRDLTEAIKVKDLPFPPATRCMHRR